MSHGDTQAAQYPEIASERRTANGA
jgi:hypothetical protein